MNKIYVISGVLFALVFGIASALVRDTVMVWYLTRALGLVSFVALFLAVVLGELRLLHLVKGNFKMFKYHIPIAILSVFLVISHFIASFVDNFKWGPQLSWFQYLGFSFGDKWLFFVSLGTLATYLLFIISITSMPKVIQKLKFKRWKLIHYFSYISFFFAYFHAINLGTDLKELWIGNALATIAFVMVLGLFLARITHGTVKFDKQLDINVVTTISFALVVGILLVGLIITTSQQEITQLQDRVTNEQSNTQEIQQQVNNINEQITNIQGGDINGQT